MIPKTHFTFTQNVTCSLFCGSASHTYWLYTEHLSVTFIPLQECMDCRASTMRTGLSTTLSFFYRPSILWHHKKPFFLHFSILDTMYQWSTMIHIHSPNLVGIGSWGPEIWPHEYLISRIEISVNWSGSKQLWTRPIYTDFNGAY